ncbi:MAG: glycosyltransferase [Actinobacteria bacterium]|nr:glycosyltransferase [Actinomycetota bacterium]
MGPKGSPSGETRALEPGVMVVVPTFNEQHNVATLVGRTFAALPDAQIVIVDDNSPDGTAATIRRLQADEPRLHLIERSEKQGLGSALIDGLQLGLERGATMLVTMDADLSHDPSALPELLAAARSHDLVVGSRYVPGGEIPRWNAFRRALSRGGNAYQHAMLRLGVKDATSGYRAYSATILRRLDLPGPHLEGFGFQIEMVRRVKAAGGTVTEVPISFTEREHGESKIDRKTILEALWHVTRWGWSERAFRKR